MHILLERKVPFEITLSVITHDLTGHSAYCDLTQEERMMFIDAFALTLHRLGELMNIRRRELGKDRG